MTRTADEQTSIQEILLHAYIEDLKLYYNVLQNVVIFYLQRTYKQYIPRGSTYGYPNQQNTEHECHSIGASMDRKHDLPIWS